MSRKVIAFPKGAANIVQSPGAKRDLRILDVQGFPLLRKWYLVQRQGKRLSTAAQAFAQFVLSEAARIARLDEGVR